MGVCNCSTKVTEDEGKNHVKEKNSVEIESKSKVENQVTSECKSEKTDHSGEDSEGPPNTSSFMEKESHRIEKDSLGEVKVPASRLWGAQTQRSLENFKIGKYRMPPIVIHSFGILKRACAVVNMANGDVDKKFGEAVVEASTEVQEGKLDDHFPLVVFQTGSGTQTNMNLNEVIGNRASQILGGEIGSKLVHPNDHVNKGQSSNDTFPTVMHVATAMSVYKKLIPSLEFMLKALQDKEEEFKDIVKCGRTHLMDATPIKLSQEFSAFSTQIKMGIERVKKTMDHVQALTIGGTAVGTGLNTREDYGPDVTKEISGITGIQFTSHCNYFEGLSSNDTMVEFHGALNTIACSLMKISNDIRLLGSGPRCGFGELILPANEPGSSIMPGKINPTQCEAVTMVCCEVMGNHTTVSIAASNGQFQLNVFKPVIIFKVLESLDLISDACMNFTKKCIAGIKANTEKIQVNLVNTLMLVTALNPVIGYDKSAKVAKKAYQEGMSLKDAADQLGFVKKEEFDDLVKPENMVVPKKAVEKKIE